MRTYVGKVLLLAIGICIITVKLNAQSTTPTSISAKVIDAQTNETVPFATASILNRKTKAVVKVAQTDVNGNLKIIGLPNGVFTFKISYIGYQTLVRDSVNINGSQKDLNFGTIKMKPAKGTVLNEVKITGQKSTMQLGIDKKVFSVDQSLISEGGSAADLLQNVPTVQTDMDGNVSLRGSTGVKVLVDGKPSLIAGGDVATILQSIPASSIESVEVINNPSAKYDAEGQSGIINIVLKKNKKLGFNGSLALTAGNRDNYNANTSLSFQNKRVNLYGNYSYRYGNRLGGGYNNITYIDMVNKVPSGYADQNTDSKNLDKGHNVKAGIDYNVTDKSTLSFSGNFNTRDNDRTDLLKVNRLNADRSPFELSNRQNKTDGNGNSYDLNMDFSQKFKKPKEELTFNLGYSKGTNDNNQTYTTEFYNRGGQAGVYPDSINTNIGTGSNKSYNIQADYSLPVGKAGKFETGYRSQIRYADNNTLSSILNNTTGNYDTDYSLTNNFHSKDQVHAIYANFQNQVGNFGYQVGLRAEDALLNTTSGAYHSDNSIIYTPGKVDYTRLYPSVFLTEKLKGDQQIQLSYSRRVNRPRAWDTNPFLDTSDPLNYRQGNPNLKPEDVHAYEFSYNKFWKKVTFISTVYVRQTNDVIERIRSLPNDQGITTTTPENLAKQLATGLELIGKVDIMKAWNFTANANLYHSKLTGSPEYGTTDNSGFSWDANLTNNFILPYNISLQLKGDYSSSQVIAQGKRNAMYGLDAGAKYDFKNKKASLSLNVRNVLNSRSWSMTTNTPGTAIDFKRYMTGPMGSLTFSYRFGRTDFISKKTKKQEQQDQQRPDEGSF
ncbi:outer membrane beta-barrel family protein [Pedobacter sp.]|jgi:outer membrane receptor protein involved in Fe transport|uniref:outer membrane beta-barrel family protein n=1 Tax=Pedobacter sp. TaxID=1411316 RepID=UPI002C1C87BB|nr:outer membrane beta-barrel family protein [Pedobacter sp.]HWW41989.1 outer membrane beta-barrel family protein [Pedobacter sp.]